jgi:hypothetical protein
MSIEHQSVEIKCIETNTMQSFDVGNVVRYVGDTCGDTGEDIEGVIIEIKADGTPVIVWNNKTNQRVPFAFDIENIEKVGVTVVKQPTPTKNWKCKMMNRISCIVLKMQDDKKCKALEATRTSLKVQFDDPITNFDLWKQRSEQWLTDVAFVNDITETICEPIALGLRPGEKIGRKRKRRKTVEYVPTETVPCEDAESESDVDTSDVECDSEYIPSEEDSQEDSQDSESETDE